LLVDDRAARSLRISAALSAVLALAACGIVGGSDSADELAIASTPANLGPQGDYPVVVGDPYAVVGTSYTPEDVMNYDQVGYLAADAAGGNTVSGSHHTLPLPSYVEVTSLETGKTIVVRLERRGPMNSNELIALSPGALAQLGGSRDTPVRVRRVNPPEDQRALLRAGMPAAPRMDTPMTLVEILKRKLPGQAAGALSVAQAQPGATGPATTPPLRTVALAASTAAPSRTGAPLALPPLPSRGQVAVATQPVTTPVRAMASTAAPAPVQRAPATGSFVVQAASFSSSANAHNAARAIEGEVQQAGNYFRVRTGPFATRGEAEASLAKVRAAGYSDARISTSG